MILATHGVPLAAGVYLDAHASSPALSLTLPVARLAPRAMEVRLVDGARLAAGATLAGHLRCNGTRVGPLPLRVARVDASAGDPARAHLQISSPDEVFARQVAAMIGGLAAAGKIQAGRRAPRHHERIDDPERIHAAVRAVVIAGSPAWIRTGDGRRVPLRDPELHAGSDRPASWALDEPLPPGDLAVEALGYNSVYRIPVTFPVDAGGGRLRIALPPAIERTRWRDQRRAAAPAAAELRFRHPVWPDLEVRRPLVDMSYGGAGFETVLAEDLLFPGLALPEVSLHAGGDCLLRTRARVARVTADAGRLHRCGLVLEERSGAWHDLVTRLLHPDTDATGAWSAEMWELYERSGYFNLSGLSPKHFAELRDAYADTSRKLARTPELGGTVVWRDYGKREIVGGISGLRLYSRSFGAFHLAKRFRRRPGGGHPGSVTRALMEAAFAPALRDERIAWCFALIQHKAGFTRRHMTFYATQARCGRGLVLPLRAYRVSGPPPGVTATTEVGVAQGAELRSALAAIQRRRSAIYVDALDLREEQFTQPSLTTTFAAAGLRRERAMLVARRRQGTEPVAAAVVDLVAEGTHLYGLFDAVRLYCLAGGWRDDVALPLMRSALSWFRARRRSTCVVLDEDGALGGSQWSGLRDMGGADLCIVSRPAMPDLMEHFAESCTMRGAPPSK